MITWDEHRILTCLYSVDTSVGKPLFFGGGIPAAKNPNITNWVHAAGGGALYQWNWNWSWGKGSFMIYGILTACLLSVFPRLTSLLSIFVLGFWMRSEGCLENGVNCLKFSKPTLVNASRKSRKRVVISNNKRTCLNERGAQLRSSCCCFALGPAHI